ncbi:thrombospondin-2-like isoform X2 [Mizuhopecten yessoensis]|uniref:thrombospondin-2-like isoform X2 n=1 Tax=Mizuhopecten yessoensis TaxID=6573 RepID=UPI000B45A1CF|nr:thrombospondin-2-like isoform X2 [Mizuhopecten yessoensis]
MKTSVCLAVFGALLVMCISSAEGSLKCPKPCERPVRVRELVSYRYWVWGRYYTFTYYTWVYRMKTVTCYEYCPIDCEWSDWIYKTNEDWSACSVTCEKGHESRPMTRSIKTQAAYGGNQCVGPDEKLDYRDCDMKECPHTICKNAGGVGHHTHLQKCDKFVQCETGKAHVKSCPSGTAWDSIGSKQCSSDAVGHCQGIACIRGMHYPHEDDCSKFYKCDHNQMLLQKCPDNQYWDIRDNTCTTDKNACEKARESGAYQPQDLKCDKVGEKVAFWGHCNKYYVCTAKGLTKMDCPQGTLFNATSLECQHKGDVSCVNDDEDDEPDTEEPKKCTNGEFLADVDDPSAFYRCAHGVRIGPTKCTGGLVFSKTHGCGWKTK